MPWFGKKKPSQANQKDPTWQKYAEVVYLARERIMTSYISALVNHWLQHQKQMSSDQQRILLVNEITSILLV